MNHEFEYVSLEQFIKKIKGLKIDESFDFSFGYAEEDDDYFYYGVTRLNVFGGEVVLMGKWGSSFCSETKIIREVDDESIINSIWDYMNYEGIPAKERYVITLLSSIEEGINLK